MGWDGGGLELAPSYKLVILAATLLPGLKARSTSGTVLFHENNRSRGSCSI